MTRVQAGYAITSVANTNSEHVEIDELELEVTAIEARPDEQSVERDGNGRNLNRAEEVLKLLRLEHLKVEERKQVEKTCAAYVDIFHLPGEALTSTTAVKHEIRMQSGVEPVNVKPYRLPEAQKQEVRKQVAELKRGGIITESNCPWNRPLILVPMNADATGKSGLY